MSGSDPLTEAFLRAVRRVTTATGTGTITVKLNLDRDPVLLTEIAERVTA